MRSFKSNENIHKKEGGSYYVVSANKASSVTSSCDLDAILHAHILSHQAQVKVPKRKNITLIV